MIYNIDMREEENTIEVQDKIESRGVLTLKVNIPAGTIVKDLYGDGDY